ncbi:MAG: hypothetical protein NVS2B12_21650 [Ktedonobacteraceae bacterium]
MDAQHPVKTGHAEWTVRLRKQRHIGKFNRWEDHDNYQNAFKRLLHGLKAEPTRYERYRILLPVR